MFTDREDAGRRLGRHLADARGPADRLVVLGLPRGGVPVAARVAEVDERLSGLRETGVAGAETLYNSLGIVSNQAQQLGRELDGGEERVGAMGGRIGDLTEALTALAGQLENAVPASLARIEQQATRAQTAAREIVRGVFGIGRRRR